MDVVRITELQPKTYVEQGDYIAIDNQSDGTKKVQFTNLLDDTLSQENKIAPANIVGQQFTNINTDVNALRAAVGSPLKASTVAQMTDTNKIYVYVGSESGYINGNWYYWDGSAWISGGVYNSVAVVTDPTLTLSGVPADAKATGDEVTNLKSAINSIATYHKSANLLNPATTMQHGFVSPRTGSFTADEAFRTVDYIPVEGGKYFVSSNNTPLFDQVRFISEWDADKNLIQAESQSTEGTGDGKHYSSAYLMLKANTRFVRVTYQLSSVDLTTRMYSQPDDVGTVPTFEAYYAPYYAINYDTIKEYVRNIMHIYAADGIESFYSKMLQAYALGNTDVHIHKGTYQYTNALIESIRADNKRGVPIGNGNHYIFEQGAEVVCEYTGNNSADVVDLFSPFDTWNTASDFEITNLKLTAKNVCYGVHDEANGGATEITHKYANCIITLDNTALGSSGNSISKAIGGGLGQHEYLTIENCIFNSINPAMTSNLKPAVSYHGANRSSFTDANISVTGCYFINGTLQGSNLSANTEAPYPTFLVTNCSLPQQIGVADTWTHYFFNNIQR